MISPAYGFLLDMVNYYPGRKIAIILSAYGGKEIAYFMRGNSSGAYNATIAAANAAVAMSGGTIRGVLWHQGESDSDAGKLTLYEDKFKTFVSSMREDLGLPSLPFLAGEITQDSRYGTYSRGLAFNAEISRIAAGMQNVYVVSSGGLTLQDTSWHFDGPSMVTFGQRYAAKMRDILSGTAD
jgi:hypothetical protein